jgi:hypothetical protein
MKSGFVSDLVPDTDTNAPSELILVRRDRETVNVRHGIRDPSPLTEIVSPEAC